MGKKKIFHDNDRPLPDEFGCSRYIERNGKVYMLDKDGKVYRLSNLFWDKAEKNLLSLRTQELKQRSQSGRNYE